MSDKVAIVGPQRAKDIICEVSLMSGVSVAEIMGHRRPARVVKARHEAIRRVAEETTWSIPRIGQIFNRDHTTILHAINKTGCVRKPRQPWADLAEARALRAAGWTYVELSKKYDIDRSTVARRLNGRKRS